MRLFADYAAVNYLQKENIMIRKCEGCGSVLQDQVELEIGYTKNLSSDLCERCFRIRHYGDYKTVSKDNESYLKILEQMNQTNHLVLLVVDLFNFNKEVYELAKKINNPCLFVFTKRDLFAKDIYNQKFIKRIHDINANIQDFCLISSKNNEGFDDLYQKIYKYKNSDYVYVAGLTNAGKSTMLNKLLRLYTKQEKEVTTSMLPSTTLDTIEIPFDDQLTFIDTPGILDMSIANVVDAKTLKKITPKKMIRPITYQIKVDQSIVIEDLLRLDIKKENNITLFFTNNLKIERYYKEHQRLEQLQKHIIDVPSNHDVLIAGLGFIKIMKSCQITLYTLPNVEVSIREALI